MNETWLGTIPLFGLLGVAIGCWLYMWGGRSGKYRRRFIGAFVLATSLWLEFLLMGRFTPWLLLVYPLTIASFSMGYGADKLGAKILRRSIIVAASLASSVGICVLMGGNAWFVLPVEGVIALTTVYIGSKNPVQAAAEEYFVCLFLWAPKLMYPFIGA